MKVIYERAIGYMRMEEAGSTEQIQNSTPSYDRKKEAEWYHPSAQRGNEVNYVTETPLTHTACQIYEMTKAELSYNLPNKGKKAELGWGMLSLPPS